MKRCFVVVLLLLSAVFALGVDTPGDQFNAISKELATDRAKRPEFETKMKAQDAKKADITFAYDAWKKQSAKYKTDLADFKIESASLKSRYEALAPAAAAYGAAVDQHNANRCTAKQGSGECNWYDAEKNQLDARKASLQAQYAPLDAKADTLKKQAAALDTTADLLDQIITRVQSDVLNWQKTTKQLINDYADNEARIKELEQKLALVRKQYDQCRGSVPDKCDRPDAVGPDGKPLLNGKCEKMHAACGRLFDGNK